MFTQLFQMFSDNIHTAISWLWFDATAGQVLLLICAVYVLDRFLKVADVIGKKVNDYIREYYDRKVKTENSVEVQ